jgi:hypothetical protein
MNAEITLEEFEKIRKIPMVFILGNERSGTTLLRTLLNSHPNIIATPESKFAVKLYPRFGKIKKWTEKDVHNIINELYKESFFLKIWRIERTLLTSRLLSIKDLVDYSSVCKIIYFSMRNDKENILVIIDKNPIYVLFIPVLLKIFPEANFIHLVRDPRDNVNSHAKSFGVQNIGFAAQKWLGFNKILRKARQLMPNRIYLLLYEDMAGETELNMKKLCSFLGVNYNKAMLLNTFSDHLKSFDTEKPIIDRAKEIHSNLFEPVNTSNIGKWKKDMSPDKIKLVEKITGKFAAHNFNYVIDQNQLSISSGTAINIFKSKIVYYCWQLFTRIRYKSYWFNNTYSKINIFLGREIKRF